MKKLVIHVGAHKTATTFLQAILLKNAAKLADKGIGYQAIGIDAAIAVNKLRINSDATYIDGAVDAVESRVDPSMHTAVLSWEGLVGMPFAERALYSGIAPFLTLLERLASRTGRELTTVLYIRRQDDFLASYYVQTIKEGMSHSVRDFMATIDLRKLSWLPTVRGLQTISRESVIAPYENIHASKAEFLDPMLNAMGVSLSDLDHDVYPANQGYSQAALNIAIFTQSRVQLGSADRKALRRMLESLPDTPKPDIITAGLRSKYAPFWAAHNQALSPYLTEAVRSYYAFPGGHDTSTVSAAAANVGWMPSAGRQK